MIVHKGVGLASTLVGTQNNNNMRVLFCIKVLVGRWGAIVR